MAFRQIKSPALGNASVISTKLAPSSVSGQTVTTALTGSETLLLNSSGTLKHITAANVIASWDTSMLGEHASAKYFTDARAVTATASAISTAVAAEATIARAAEGVNAAAITTEETRATAAEGVNASGLATEISDRAAADAVIDAAYKLADTGLQTQISNILTNVDATALNSLSEIVTEFQSQDSALSASVIANGTNITNEVTRATAAEGVNASAISAEAVTARAAELANATAIATETAARIAAAATLTADVATNTGDIATLTSGLAAEISATGGEITTLTIDLAAEATTARAAEAANATDVAAEAVTRASADSVMAADIATNVTDIATNATNIANILTNTDATALNSLTEIVTAFQLADGNLGTLVATNVTAIAAEETRARAAEVLNAAAVVTETSRATAAEGVNALAITANTGDITTNAADIATNVSAISTEATTARAAELVNANAITAEATTARAAELVNANDIAAEATRAGVAEAANASAISGEITRATNKDNAHDTLLASHTTDISANATNLSNEIARAQSAESTLTIDTASNTTAIANILTNTDATALNSLAEIVTEFQSVDATLTGLSTAASTDRALIRTEFAAADTALSTRITTEEGNVDTLETTMGSTVLSTTAQTVTGAINELNTGASAQAAANLTEINAIETSVGLNANGSFTAHSGTNYIDSGTTMKGVDALLDVQAKVNADAVVTEETRATAAEGVNNAAIIAEAVTARAAESANASAITAEASTARAAEAANATATAANLVEITSTQAGAGLSVAGAYVAPSTSNYHDAAATLAGADMLIDAAVKAEEVRALAAEGTLTTNVATNAAGIATNVTAIATNATAIANIISNVDAASLDSLTEIVAAFQAADGTLTGAVAANTTQVATNVTDIASNVTALATKLALAGGTMSGDIAMGGSMVSGLGAPVASGDAVSKSYLEAQIAASDSILDMVDVSDASYVGKEAYVLQVNANATGMELADPLSIFTTQSRQTIPGDGVATTYSLTITTDQANSMVFVGGVIQDPSTHYTINGSASTITFTSALPTGTSAVVVANQNGLTPVLTTGQVTTDILAADIKAYVQKTGVSATGTTTVDSFNGVLYRSAKYVIQVDDGAGNYETREALVVHDGTTAYITEYAMVYTGSDLIGDASVSISGNTVQLDYTPTSGSATVKVIATYIDV